MATRDTKFRRGVFRYKAGAGLIVDGDLEVTGALSAGDGITFNEPLTLSDPFTSQDAATFEDDVQIDGAANVDGTLTGVDGTFSGTVTGSDLVSTDDVTVGDDLTVTGLATIGETLGVTGITTLTSDLVKSGASGSKYTLTTITAQASVSGSVITFTNFIPAGSLVFELTARVTTEITATASVSFKIGEAGDDDRWGASNAFAAGTTVAKGTVANIGGLFWAASATSVVITGNAGDDLLTGAVRISAVILTPTAPTS